MADVRKLTDDQLEAFARIAANAYPGAKHNTPDGFERLKENMKKTHALDWANYYGCFRDDKLVGGMMELDYTMNLHAQMVPIGGVGFVAVDLLHKKEKVAKELITEYCRHYRERDVKLVALYPFRPDFYHAMGFGYGTKSKQYRIHPSDLPKGGAKELCRFLFEEDREAVGACYNRFARRVHGMFLKMPTELEVVGNINAPTVGYEEDGVLRGYVRFFSEPAVENNFTMNNLVVRELIYETPQALQALMAFMNSQSDQYQQVIFNTQDENIHFLFHDPRNGSRRLLPPVGHETNAEGIGVMYRVVDVPGVFGLLADHDFGGQTVKLKLTMRDTLLPENAGSTIVHVENGRARVVESGEFDVEVKIDIAEFSALLVGSADFIGLQRLGLAEISDERYLRTVHRVFLTDCKPVTTTAF